MAKNFGKANSAKAIAEVAKASNEKANVIQVKMIRDEKLFDYPQNEEDIIHTTDLEESIKNVGFTDPIDITDFNMKEGNYTIVSGHRRRMAGRKVGISTFPCIVRHFNNAEALHNFVLLSNSQRDSSKDPLLYCRRYKMHEEYLINSNFQGSIREKVAERLGISIQQADRYNQFNKIILPVWDMVKNEIVGMSSVLPMATHSVDEQNEILKIMLECLESGSILTRDMCNEIIKGYRSGKKTFLEMIQYEIATTTKKSSGISIMNIDSEPIDSNEKESSSFNQNNEIDYDYSHRETFNDDHNESSYEKERLTKEDYNAIDLVQKTKETERKKVEQGRTGDEMNQCLKKLERLLNEYYEFESKEIADTVMKTMDTMIQLLSSKIKNIESKYYKEQELQLE